MDIILSTRNPTKAKSIMAIFDGIALNVLTLDDAGIAGEAIEDGATLEENAEKKARFAFEQTKKCSVADDTGIFIDALDGQPGIHAARWAGDSASTEDIMEFTLEKLKDVPMEKRTATFKTVAALIDPNGITHFFTGEIKGKLLEKLELLVHPKCHTVHYLYPTGTKSLGQK